MPDTLTRVTLDQAVAALKEVVTEAGENYVYPKQQAKSGPTSYAAMSCLYEAGGQPSCGVGRVLFKLGVPVEVLDKLDFAFDPSIGTTEWGEDTLDDWKSEGVNPQLTVHQIIADEAGIDVSDPQVVAVLSEFQNSQDSGQPYGRALDRALAKV